MRYLPRGAIMAAPASACISSSISSPRASADVSPWIRRPDVARLSASGFQGMLALRRLSQRRNSKLADQDDFLQIIEDQAPPPESGPRWKVAVIDDDPAVHDGTRFALSDYTLNGQRLEILSASSAAEGREFLARHPDVAPGLPHSPLKSPSRRLQPVTFPPPTLQNTH